jgi:dihydrofolate reductase
MRKMILYIACSLDGYIARTDGSVDWLYTDADYGYSDFYISVDTVIMGRKTYQKILGAGEFPYQGKECFVISRSRAGSRDRNVQYPTDDLKVFVGAKKAEAGKNIWLVGGGELTRELLQLQLIDEIMLYVHPLILGAGIPLFRGLPSARNLTLLGCQPHTNGLVELHYACTFSAH